MQEWLKMNCTDIENDQTATKLTTPQPTRLPFVECDASSISQISVKAKDHPKAKKCTAADLGWLDTDNDQQNYQ